MRDHPGYCTAEVGNPGRNYELPCIFSSTVLHFFRFEQYTFFGTLFSIYIFTSQWETEFHAHIKEQIELKLYRIQTKYYSQHNTLVFVFSVTCFG